MIEMPRWDNISRITSTASIANTTTSWDDISSEKNCSSRPVELAKVISLKLLDAANTPSTISLPTYATAAGKMPATKVSAASQSV